MAPSDVARKNHDELFPGYVSTLAVTDPELIEYFDNFAGGRGSRRTEKIVGSDAVDRMYANAPDDEQHIQRYLSANCFGDHYTRGGIGIEVRELLTLSMLIAMGGADPQVKGHVVANLNVGNDRPVLLTVITQLLPFVGYPRTLNAIRALDEVTRG